jgi:shikimate kinase
MASSFSKSNAIILIGYMGSGKSTVGRMLAQKHNISFQDLDDIIAKNACIRQVTCLLNKVEYLK